MMSGTKLIFSHIILLYKATSSEGNDVKVRIEAPMCGTRTGSLQEEYSTTQLIKASVLSDMEVYSFHSKRFTLLVTLTQGHF
jgi:hypothetical protein